MANSNKLQNLIAHWPISIVALGVVLTLLWIAVIALAATAAFVFRVVFRKKCLWMLDAVQPRFRVSMCVVTVLTFDAALRQKKEQPRLCGLAEAIPPIIGLLSTVRTL